MTEERHISRDRNDIEIRSVNEDSPGIETMPEITPEMISPNPPQSSDENSQTDQSPSTDEGSNSNA
ncbi:MAG: hypothetical protein OXI19_03600 [Gemmatimonadota bacterium]|nr:hypothetical protein [Gemmatimonadota bacterium]